MATTNKGTYILSLEGNEIYSHMVRGKEIKLNYTGMIPYSLELLKLQEQKEFSVRPIKNSKREITDDIINVKFKQKVRSGEFLLESIPDAIEEKKEELSVKETKLINATDEKVKEKLNKSIPKLKEYIERLKEFLSVLKREKDSDKWKALSNEELREYLYLNGFTITRDNGTQTHYIVYKRSSSKSRTGQCLFIKESLHEEMIKWSRMYLDFPKDEKIDYASLLAYESLVGSSLEDTMIINPKNILIVKDVESTFTKKANVIRKGDEFLESVLDEKATITNSLFDGESLLDSDYFPDGQSMKLLRNHMFKSAAFNCNIQEFLKDKCPDDIPFDEWELTDMFDYPILAKDVHLIITPSSLKALRFSHVFEGENKEKQMWNYWQDLIDKEGSTFGVCKHEKKSKRGVDFEGNILQQMSYQMINCLPMEREDITNLTRFEGKYIDKLKNDDDFYVNYLIEEASDMNSNRMFVDLYKRNKKFANIKLFRDFRKAEINKYVTHCKKGKIRLVGDYCVMLGNPMEFLYHAIGKFDVESSELSLKDNEIYTTLFDFDKEYVGFRNPNTSPSNVLVAKNTNNKDIEKYFNLTDNIVCVNAVGFEIQDILSGCDYDSDTMLLFDSEKLLELGKKCFGKYPVCINHVESQKKSYKLNNMDMATIDNQLATSQKNIGKVVNLGQLCMSIYWDQVVKDEELMHNVDVMTVLSGIAIDMSKKLYEIDIDKEIKHVESEIQDVIKVEKVIDAKGNEKEVKRKPLFFKYISQSKTIKGRVKEYNCPMDFLHKEMKLKYADKREDIDFLSLLDGKNQRNSNRKQKEKIEIFVEKLDDKIKNIFAEHKGESEDIVEERNILIDNQINYFSNRVQKLTVKEDTMYSILKDIVGENSKIATKLLNILYITQKEVFLAAFIEN